MSMKWKQSETTAEAYSICRLYLFLITCVWCLDDKASTDKCLGFLMQTRENKKDMHHSGKRLEQ